MLSPEHRSRLMDSQSPKELYLRLIGLDALPASPDELPDTLALPSGFALPIKRALGETSKDGRERAGHIRWNPQRRMLISKRMRPGTETS